MNFLVYLSGPIIGLTFDKSEDWRHYIKSQVDERIECLSPLRGKDISILRDGPIKDCYEEHPLTSSKGISARDLYDTRRCDAVLVNVLGAKTVSIGTVMEIAWAKAFNKPIILVIEEGNPHTHAMLSEACAFQVNNLDSAITILETILFP